MGRASSLDVSLILASRTQRVVVILIVAAVAQLSWLPLETGQGRPSMASRTRFLVRTLGWAGSGSVIAPDRGVQRRKWRGRTDHWCGTKDLAWSHPMQGCLLPPGETRHDLGCHRQSGVVRFAVWGVACVMAWCFPRGHLGCREAVDGTRLHLGILWHPGAGLAPSSGWSQWFGRWEGAHIHGVEPRCGQSDRTHELGVIASLACPRAFNGGAITFWACSLSKMGCEPLQWQCGAPCLWVASCFGRSPHVVVSALRSWSSFPKGCRL